MSDTVSALAGQSASGLARIRDAGPVGMITLRGDLASSRLRGQCTQITGTAFPKTNRIETANGRSLVWMSPDEVLLLLPHAEAAATVAQLAGGLAGSHALAVDVSDARAVIHVDGPGAREVLAKLTPADLRPSAFSAGQVRRTRLAQVPAAIWLRNDTDFTLVCFRSVARYAFDLLANAARTGGAVRYF